MKALWLTLALCLPQDDPPRQDVTELDLDDLMKVKVTSVARKEQSLTEVPAAIAVIRGEDLQRMGATTIQDGLRGVPGMEVARATANSWAVTARGFNGTSANKLLVLMDGRSVYSPLHSGVFWDVQDAVFDDIDRIEVIRGPGGTLWGANAINGVVNVIAKPASETLGVVSRLGVGTEEQAFGSVRYGFAAGENAHARVYAKYFDRDDLLRGIDTDEDNRDGYYVGRGGFRLDWKTSETDMLTVSGDAYGGQAKLGVTQAVLNPPSNVVSQERLDLRGTNLLARWTRTMSETSRVSVQAYYDHSYRSQVTFTDILHTADLEFDHHFELAGGHEISWGGGYRVHWSDFGESFSVSADPRRRIDDLVSCFVQDELVLAEKLLKVIVGSKFEYNDYSGFEVQPSGRVAWTPHERHMAWAAVSRAVRTPSIIDVDLRINANVQPGPTVLAVFGNRDFRSEEVLAWEGGYRVRPVDMLSLDLAFFYNRYRHLRSLETGAPFTETDPPPSHTVVPFFIDNRMAAQTYGVELGANVQVTPWLLAQATWTHLRMNLDPRGGSTDTFSEAAERQNPRNQFWVRAAADLPANVTLDVMARYVGRLAAYDIDAYTEVDVRLAWKVPEHGLEVAVVGQNLMRSHHPEFNAETSRSEVQRAVYVSVGWRF